MIFSSFSIFGNTAFAFDSLSSIEAEHYDDPALAEDIIRSREDTKHDRLTSQGALIKELHLFGN